MPKKTPNYQLNQWDPEDDFLRSDFNEDNAKLDAALAQKCEVVLGTYTGNGNQTEFNNISIGFQPRAILIADRYGLVCEGNTLRGGLFTPENAEQAAYQYFRFTDDGFAVKTIAHVAHLNETNLSPYVFLAVR